MRNALLLTLLCFSGMAAAQTYSLKGYVTGADKKAVEFGNAVVLRPSDSSLVTGSPIRDGNFSFDTISQSPVLLRISAAGCKTSFRTVTRNNAEVDLGTITLESNQLKEVEIAATIPLIQKQADRTRVNVEGTMLNAAGDALDVLESSPGLMVSPEGTVTVFGKGAAVVLLDGQKVPIELIRAIPSTQIRYIEIIDHPPASYDAQGRVVVNVVTKQNALEGYQLDLTSAGTYAPGAGNTYFYDGANMLWKKNKFSLISRYGIFAGTRLSNTEYLRHFESTSGHVTMRNAIEETKHFRGNHGYGAAIKYDIDSTRNLNLFYNGGYNQIRKISNDTNLVDVAGTPYLIHAITSNHSHNLNHNLSLVYTVRPDTLGSKRTFTGSVSQFDSDQIGDIDETVSDSASASSTPKRSTGHNLIRIGTLQTDIAHAFSSKKLFEYGAKISTVKNGSSAGLDRQLSTGWVSDTSMVNAFDYTEQTGALYAQYTMKPGHWNIRPGVRGEMTHTKGFSHKQNATIIDTNYFNVFPSLMAEYSLMKDLSLTGEYAFRIDRPSFQDLDPFVMYIDSLSSMRGNPNLRPEYTHESSLTLTYLEAASLELDYSYTKNAINTYIERIPNSDQFTAQERNFDYATEYQVELDLPYQNKWWTTSNNFGYAYIVSHYQDATQDIVNARPMFYFFTYQSFKVLKRWNIEGIFNYNNGGADGLFIGQPAYGMRLSLQYKTPDGKGTIRLIGNDLLRSYKEVGNSKIPGFDLRYTERSDSYFFRLVLNWKFGKLKQRDFSEQSINESERNRIKN